MTRTLVPVLAVAALVTAAVGLLTADGWPGYVVGAGLALALWVMLYCGSLATPARGTVAPRAYALAALLGVVLGYVVFRIGGGGAFWAVGFILAGTVLPAVPATKPAAQREARE